jgi:hypothetical protein
MASKNATEPHDKRMGLSLDIRTLGLSDARQVGRKKSAGR